MGIFDFLKRDNTKCIECGSLIVGDQEICSSCTSEAVEAKKRSAAKSEKLKDINLKGLKNLFLVDLVLKFYKKNHKITTTNIKTLQRKDNPRIGNYFFANIKIFKILKFILNYKN